MKYKIDIVLKSFEQSLLRKENDKILKFLAAAENFRFYKPEMISSSYNIYYLPSRKNLFTIIRSPHIDKKSRDQFFFTQSKSLLKIELTSPLSNQDNIQNTSKHSSFLQNTSSGNQRFQYFVASFVEHLKQNISAGLQMQIKICAKSYSVPL